MTTTDLLIILAWLLVTGVGMVLTITMMLLTRSDLRFLKEQHVNGDVIATTKVAFWQEFRRFLVKLFLFSLGIEAFFAPRPDPEPKQTVLTWIFTGMLFGVVLLMNYSTYAAMKYRRNFLTQSRAPSSKETLQRAQHQQIIEGLEELHQDNLEDAETLFEADKNRTRKVRNGEEDS